MTPDLVKPPPLRPGDTVAVVSASWGGPATYPATFDAGLRVLRDTSGLEVVEAATARMAPEALKADPRLRAETLNALFFDPDISAIIATIGGDDSVRILPWLDTAAALAHPKIFLGYSDTAAQNVAYHLAGLVTFNGPAVMAGFAQMQHFASAKEHVRSMLFGDSDHGSYLPYPQWVDRYADWADPANADAVGPLQDHDGWHWLNGDQVASGRLFGGCVEVLEMLKGTRWWPNAASSAAGTSWWDDRVLFLETSEDKPSVDFVRCSLRNYGAQGVFDHLSALWVGRARSYTDAEKQQLDEALVDVVVTEFGRDDLPIVSNLDFGHTDPQWVLPLGVRVETDPGSRTLGWTESPTG